MNQSRNAAAAKPLVQKLILSFRKAGLLRFLSHHDLMGVFARACRRAELPVRQTVGFNPQPRLSFPAPLEVGVAALRDPLEVELTAWVPAAEVVTRLNAHLPAGLGLIGARLTAPIRAGAVAAWSRYRWEPSPADGVVPEAAERLARLGAFLVPRVLPPKRGSTQPRRRQVDVLAVLAGLRSDGPAIEWLVRHGETAVPRAAEMAAALRAISREGSPRAEVSEAEVVPVGAVVRTEVGLKPTVVNFLDADWWKQPAVDSTIEESLPASDEVTCA